MGYLPAVLIFALGFCAGAWMWGLAKIAESEQEAHVKVRVAQELSRIEQQRQFDIQQRQFEAVK